MFAVYGVLMIVGGVIGHNQTGSKASLIAGVISGILIGGAVVVSLQKPVVGYGAVVGVAVILCAAFAKRFLKTQAFMPSGMLLVMSLVVVLLGVFALIKLKTA
jgi:uncharacterized membrane protein (UPF0136 family)